MFDNPQRTQNHVSASGPNAAAGAHVGNFLPPLMVLLTAAVRPGVPQPAKLQALEVWAALVRALARHAPAQLADSANQARCSYKAWGDVVTAVLPSLLIS